MHDEQAPPLTPGAQSDQSPEEFALSSAPATEFDVELPFDGADAPAPTPPAEAEVAEAAEVTDAVVVDAAGEGVTDAAADAADAPVDEAIATDDPDEAILRKLALLAEAEAIVATPDKNESGNAPDDRHLTERMRAVENVWRRVGPAGDREVELRTRLQDLRQAYSAARSRRAESRAVDRARAGETKRALLVQAFALAQQVDPSVALPSAPAPRAARPAARRRPSPAMLARKPAQDAATADVPTTGVATSDAPAAVDEAAPAVPDSSGDVSVEGAQDAPVEAAPTEALPSDETPAVETVLAHDGAADA